MQENTTLREFLEKELGCKTKPLYEEFEKSKDSFILAVVVGLKNEKKDMEEGFVFTAKRGGELIERVKKLIREFYVRNDYIVIYQFPQKPKESDFSFHYIIEKNAEKKTVAVTFEKEKTLLTVMPNIHI